MIFNHILYGIEIQNGKDEKNAHIEYNIPYVWRKNLKSDEKEEKMHAQNINLFTFFFICWNVSIFHTKKKTMIFFCFDYFVVCKFRFSSHVPKSDWIQLNRNDMQTFCILHFFIFLPWSDSTNFLSCTLFSFVAVVPTKRTQRK